jgi:amidase
MATFSEYERYDAIALADLVRRRKVSPRELVEAAIERIERANPRINAVIHPLYDQARRAAEGVLPDGPFAGVPFLLKDLQAAYAGAPMRSGSRFYGDWSPPHHSELVRRFLASGVIVLGKTNTPELGLLPTTEPLRFGPSRNPWDLKRTTGGSSGGSAAAVAARMVPMAGGGDGGGSIRIPASCCGIFGLKPTRGRTPSGPDATDPWQGFGVDHVLTRSVRDSAAMLDATAGPDAGAPYAALSPKRPFLAEVGCSPGRLRIAFSAEPYLPAREVDPDCQAALEDAVTLLRQLGHEVFEARPALDGHAFAKAFLTMITAETWADVREAERIVGRRARPNDFEMGTWLLAILGKSFSAGECAVACRYLKSTGRRIAAFMDAERVDVLLSPTLARMPIHLGTLLPRGPEGLVQRVLTRLSFGGMLRVLGALDRGAREAFSFIPYTPVFNASGQPSMSVPLSWTAAGLPVGLMFTARWGEEATLFRLASQLEEARPWSERRPPI